MNEKKEVALRRIVTAIEVELTNPLSDEDRKTLTRTLEGLIENWEFREAL